MSRDYSFAFGANPSTNTGLSPTFTYFANQSGATLAPPTISELLTGSGIYKVSYNATQMVSFILDGATTGLATSDRYIFGVFDPADKFAFTLSAMGSTLSGIGSTLSGMGSTLTGVGSTLSAIGTNVNNQGSTLVGIGNTSSSYGSLITNLGSTLVGVGSTISSMSTLFGSTQSSFGSTSVDPNTVFGYLRRLQELSEGNQVYTKSTGLFELYSRGSGTTTLLRRLTVTDTTTLTSRE